MNRRFLLSLAIAASVSALGMPTIARSQTRIGDLQQRPPGTTISGKVTSVVGNDLILEDESGQIIVDAGPRWWQRINISPGEQVTVNSELGRGGEFDAFSITRANGTVFKFALHEVQRLGLAVLIALLELEAEATLRYKTS